MPVLRWAHVASDCRRLIVDDPTALLLELLAVLAQARACQ